MLLLLPNLNYRKLLSVGLAFMFIGGFILTVSNSGAIGKGHNPKGSLGAGVQPPIYPNPGQEVTAICNVSLSSSKFKIDDSIPLIYLVTPTYTRREQIAELTRLGNTLLNVPNLHWIISEDAEQCSPMVEALLQRFDIPYTHIISPMPKMYNSKSVKYKPRGVSSRRAAMKWIISNYQQKSVLYFADDDNTYDLRLFDEIRKTQKVSVFPVAFIGIQSVSSPVVESRDVRGADGKMTNVNKVVGFADDWFASRKFAMDMAGFAVDVEFLASNQHAAMPYKAGYEEDYFLQSLNITMDDLEPLADGCTQVLVWHTRALKGKVPVVKLEKNQDTNLHQLLNDFSVKGIVQVAHNGQEVKVCRKVKGCE